MKKICVVTGSRADYGLLYWILKEIENAADLELAWSFSTGNFGPREYQKNYGNFRICMAKTQYSFSTDPSLKGAPTGHVLPVREVRLSSGAEFIVVICGAIMTK